MVVPVKSDQDTIPVDVAKEKRHKKIYSSKPFVKNLFELIGNGAILVTGGLLKLVVKSNICRVIPGYFLKHITAIITGAGISKVERKVYKKVNECAEKCAEISTDVAADSSDCSTGCSSSLSKWFWSWFE